MTEGRLSHHLLQALTLTEGRPELGMAQYLICYFWCMNTKSHTGLPSVAHMCGRVVVLCPQKHVVSAHKPEDWAHSSAEANMHLPVTCQGSN